MEAARREVWFRQSVERQRQRGMLEKLRGEVCASLSAACQLPRTF
jgi:hypothetical protein